MNKQRLVVVATAVLGGMGSFLPWISIMGISANGMQGGDGYITLVLFLPALIISLVGDRTKNLGMGKILGSIIPALLASAIAFMKISDIPMGLGIGLILIAVAPLLMTIGAFVIKDKTN
jgi:hypothetical protein|uniref:hypothetical protein n=1 Tax=Fluviicola sp. TaxID=1917219 RepID=UPI00404AF761